MHVKHLIDDGKSIKETAETYGISIDTLYYYEKLGLVVPHRNPYNSYRVYTSENFFRLNVILELRAMGLSLEDIQEYLRHHDFQSTLNLMDKALKSIREQRDKLVQQERDITEELKRDLTALSKAQSSKTTFVRFPDRPCELASTDLLFYEDIPYAFAQYMTTNKHERLKTLRSIPTYLVDTTQTVNGCFPAKAIMLYTGEKNPEVPYIIKEGLYACRTFEGPFLESVNIYEKMKEEIAELGYRICGDPIEMCLIGAYESDILEEHVSHIEVPVEPTEISDNHGLVAK
ncbi:DNA-binding transcriptional regulator, MerR family [Bifidobacterium bohemicum]|uniref:MerR family transcriptional regulator n=2 Tax=Bifidobacterium bohemicum TaxID=638617 RepID=A0A086ZJD8_9BIFI|nr:MerR family transcriptional regulator [Bifidobacterium bohemicum DSM 22767]SCB77430.1 DNA-binding transcriptional regulator, MerR family [Bifidobacterium bohemicum]